jgi:gliding motility-associated-like protein
VRTNWSDPGAGITSGTTTICFTSPVTSPVLLLSSIGNGGTSVPLKFSTNFNLLFDGGGLSGVSTNSLVGKEGYAILEFPGAFTCVSIVSDAYEFYANLTWGIKNQTTHTVITTPACSGNNNGTAFIKVRGSINTFTYSITAPVSKGPQTDSTFTGLAPGTYTYLIQNSVPCSYSGTFTIGSAPSPTLAVSATPTVICAGNSSELTVNGANTYTWSTGANTASITVTPTVTTTYTVEGTNLLGCKSASTLTVNIINPLMTVNSKTICLGQSAVLNAGGVSTYTWSTGSNASSTTITPSGTTIYTVEGTDASGCKTAQTATVEVLHPVAKFEGIDKSVYEYGDIISLTNTSTDATDYEWIFCNGTLSPNIHASLALADSGNCCIKLIAKKLQCADTTSKCFYVNPETYILIPNVFTPNGDGSNEVFKIKSVGVKDLNCIIYDRWGLKLFEWTGINGYWDGKAKTGPATSGTYYYIVKYTTIKGTEKTEKGFLTLFKD